MFRGSMVALVTPMHEDGSIDQKSLKELIEWHIESKTAALIIAGTTGEAPTLEAEEYEELLQFSVKTAAGRIPIIAGTGTNSTDKTIKNSLKAKKAGVAACLIVTPYYNKPTQDGLYKHYKTIIQAIDMPVIAYNVPGRTGCDLLPETIERLSEFLQLVGVKEASGKVERCTEILKRCPDLAVYSGCDDINSELFAAGAQGVISVTANIAPRKMAEFCAAALSGDQALAARLNAELADLNIKLFVESNPIPTKWALSQMGLIPTGIRLPLTPLDSKYHPEVNQAMLKAGVTL